MPAAKLNRDMIALKAGEITVYNFDGKTYEYLSSSVEYLAVGIGLPANSCADAPLGIKKGFVVCRTADLSAWEYVTDHRGETVYSKDTGQPSLISMPGDYPSDITPEAPTTPYDIWDGEKWITDTEKQHAADIEAAEARKTVLITKARSAINLWQTELELGVISENDKARLINWLAYIKTLEVVDTDAAPEINWPDKPTEC